MSANTPILTVAPPAPHPNEHIQRYLSSIHPHQPSYAREGERIFKNEQEHGFEEVASHWAKGDSSSAGMWSEVVMGRRARAGSSPPRLVRTGMEPRRSLRTFDPLPIDNLAGLTGVAVPSRMREAVQERNEGYGSETSSADRREQRKLRRREKAAIRRPPEPIPTAPLESRKRQTSLLEGSEGSYSRSILPVAKRRRGKGEADDIVRHFEASNVPVKRLTLKPGTTKGFLHRGAESVPARPAVRRMAEIRRPHPPLRDEGWEMSWLPTINQRPKVPFTRSPIDIPAYSSAVPRFGPVRPLPNLPLNSHTGFMRGHLPPPGRTNSTSWPSEIHSRSSQRNVGTLLSPDPVGTPLHDNAFGLSSARPNLGPSPFAHVGSALPHHPKLHQVVRSTSHPVIQQRERSSSLRLPVSPPPASRYVPPEHVEKLGTDLTQNPKIQSVTPDVSASLPPRSMTKERKVSIHIRPCPSSEAAKSPPYDTVIPTQTLGTIASDKKPLIHPYFHEEAVERGPASVIEERPFRIHFTRTSPQRLEETPVGLKERPHIRIEPVHDPDQSDQSFSPFAVEPVPNPDPLWPFPAIPTIYHSNSESYPLRQGTKLDVTSDNPFLSERNPFLASRQHPTQNYDSYPSYPSFSSPPPPSKGLHHPNYLHEGYGDVQYITEETESFVQGYGFGDSATEGDDDEDLRNFWKDRPAVL